MKILYITTQVFVKDLDTRYLDYFSEKEDIHVVASIEEGQSFIKRELVLLRRHIDFILLDRKGLEEDDIDIFRAWLEKSVHVYSRDNFKLSGLPLILIHEPDWNATGDIRTARDKYMFYHSTRLEEKQKVVSKAIDEFLHQIGDDLDHFDLDLRLKFDDKRMPSLIEHRAYRLKILTENFFRRMQKLPYIWFGENLKTFDISLNRFDDLLRKSERMPSLRNEKEIHAYLSENKRIILGEFYENLLYEKQLYLTGSRQYVEPDFINIPYSHFPETQEIFEVKLPSQRLVRKDKKIFYRNTVRALQQVNLKYREFFSSPENLDEIYRKTGYSKNKYNYTLLIGRKRDKEESLEFLNSYGKVKDLRLITYDELPEYFQRLYDRTRRFNLN